MCLCLLVPSDPFVYCVCTYNIHVCAHTSYTVGQQHVAPPTGDGLALLKQYREAQKQKKSVCKPFAGPIAKKNKLVCYMCVECTCVCMNASQHVCMYVHVYYMYMYIICTYMYNYMYTHDIFVPFVTYMYTFFKG